MIKGRNKLNKSVDTRSRNKDNTKFSKREFLGWICLWGLVATVATSCNDAEASERVIEVPKFTDVSKTTLGTVELMASNLYHEARSQSDVANFMILSVVENRKNIKNRYGNTYEEVILKPHAFSWLSDGLSDRMYEEEQYKRLYKLTERFLADKRTYLSLAKGADHYVKVGHVTNWDYSKLEFLFQIDSHLFYKHK